MPTLLPAGAALSAAGQEVPGANRIYGEVHTSEVETEDGKEPLFPDDNVETAETLIFRPHYKYWQRYFVQRKKKQADRNYPGHE